MHERPLKGSPCGPMRGDRSRLNDEANWFPTTSRLQQRHPDCGGCPMAEAERREIIDSHGTFRTASRALDRNQTIEALNGGRYSEVVMGDLAFVPLHVLPQPLKPPTDH